MSFQEELAAATDEMITEFGRDRDGAELTLTHLAQTGIRCWQGDASTATEFIAGGLAPVDSVVFHALRADFNTAPKTGDLITCVGTYRVDLVLTSEEDPEIRLVCEQQHKRPIR
jgi:hypothetical protein